MTSRPRRARIAVALGLLVAVLAQLGALPATGSAYDGRPGDRSDRSDRSRVPGTTRFGVVDHNVERRTSAIDAALDRAARANAPVVLLQEVCWWQADAIRADHPRWTVGWKADVDSKRCQRQGLAGITDGGRMKSGNVAIWTGGARGYVTTYTFRSQGSRRFRSGAVCVSWRATGVTRRACSTHLVNAAKVPQRRGSQFRQARELRRLTKPWIRRDNFVVVGGDFNAGLGSRTLDPMYAVGGNGRFQEATRCPRVVDFCRRSLATTFDGGVSKIDYIFYSANRVPAGATRALQVIPTLSDHHLLNGWAYVDLSD